MCWIVLNGNKGEWSELYVFCYLLKEGILKTADKDLNAVENVYFPIVKIIRNENMGRVLDYCPGTMVKIYEGDTLIREIPNEEFAQIVDVLKDKIRTGRGRAFKISEVEDFFDDIFVCKVKADSAHKQDIDIQIHDMRTGMEPVCGFSVKSYFGGKPTLINAVRGTNFIYEIENCNEQIAKTVNAIDTERKIIDKINFLLENGCRFQRMNEMISSRFKENLEFVDSKMPAMLSEILLVAYKYGIKNMSEVVERIKDINPLGYSNTHMYEYKIKKLLCACALGMTPEKQWEGEEDASGGYIVVKKDGSVVCYHIYNRSEFEQYLYDYTYFDKPSTSRHDYMTVYQEDGKYKIKFNLQVRFK